MFQAAAIFLTKMLCLHYGIVRHTLSAILGSDKKKILHEMRNNKSESRDAHVSPKRLVISPEIKMSLHPMIKWLKGFHLFKMKSRPEEGGG
jgi:hypothetical protein